jgi:phosphoglycerate kinase
MNSLVRMPDVDLRHKRVLIREDFNVPLHDGVITSDARILAALPTIRQALAQEAAVILLSHLGRPTEGQFDSSLSLAPIAERLSQLLQKPVRLVRDWLDGVEVKTGEVVLCENVRFNVGEKANDPHLAQRMAQLADVVVMDAFAVAHRAEASTEGMLRVAPVACAGPLLLAEIDALSQALSQPARPWLALVGGAKVSSKLQVLDLHVGARLKRRSIPGRNVTGARGKAHHGEIASPQRQHPHADRRHGGRAFR